MSDSESYFGEIIYSYTHAQALADGVLIDISKIAREAGFILPVAVSDHLYHDVLNPGQPLLDQGQSLEGRIWDMLNILRYSIKTNPETSRLAFYPLFVMSPNTPPSPVKIVSTIGPSDKGGPIITIFLPEDD
jgi:hypothetical protein